MGRLLIYTMQSTFCILSLWLSVTVGITENLALSCEDCNFTRILNENEQFSLSSHGAVYLAKFLDYRITNKYHLVISVHVTDGSEERLTLTILVNDVMNWPPVFNESCALRSNKTNQGLLYNIFLGQERTPYHISFLLLSNEEFKNRFYSNTSNSECSTYLYFITRRGKHSFEESKRLQVQCDPILPTISVEVSQVENTTRIDHPEWFDHPLSEYVFVIIKLSHMPPSVKKGKCIILTHDFNFATDITFLPLGCSPGKYGFKCENDCVCQNGARCHAFNGACECTAGWRGPACDIPSLKSVESIQEVVQVAYGDVTSMGCLSYHLEVKDHRNIVWYKGNEVLEEDAIRRLNIRNRNGNSTISIRTVTDSDAGIYVCEIKDITGRKYRASSELIVTGCRDGKWGSTCSETCNCQHSAPCDRYEGCLCLPGWNGTTCSVDIQTPVIDHCPDDKVILADDQSIKVSVRWEEPDITDNSAKVNMTSNFKSGDKFGYGTYRVVYQAIDEGQNNAYCQFSITVKKSAARTLSAVFIGTISSLIIMCLLGQYLVYKYRHEIQTIVADKLQAYEDDDQREFDAFVSVKGDTAEEEFVYKTLLPTLEDEYGYRLCVHHRDFVIGEAIVENIVMAIKESRRTILILSPAFVESEWCDYELALAHTEMIGLRQKLIPIMFDDITKMPNIRASLQSILNTITYINWPQDGVDKDIKKFWKRLVKAMPKRNNMITKGQLRQPQRKIRWYITIRNRLCNSVCCFRVNRNIRRRNDSVESDRSADDEIPLMLLNDHC